MNRWTKWHKKRIGEKLRWTVHNEREITFRNYCIDWDLSVDWVIYSEAFTWKGVL